MSSWSHRHVAYFAGLGTFGLNNMLITEKGCCGRLGSLVTTAPIDMHSSPEYGLQNHEKCLNKTFGNCGLCIGKCVADAYTDHSFDRFRCYAQCLENAQLHCEMGYADVCGKCLVGLPCSYRAPC